MCWYCYHNPVCHLALLGVLTSLFIRLYSVLSFCAMHLQWSPSVINNLFIAIKVNLNARNQKRLNFGSLLWWTEGLCRWYSRVVNMVWIFWFFSGQHKSRLTRGTTLRWCWWPISWIWKMTGRCRLKMAKDWPKSSVSTRWCLSAWKHVNKTLFNNHS